MLDAQGVVDLLLELDIRVDFVRNGNGSVKALDWGERAERKAKAQRLHQIVKYCGRG
jgi:hypothetical protein